MVAAQAVVAVVQRMGKAGTVGVGVGGRLAAAAAAVVEGSWEVVVGTHQAAPAESGATATATEAVKAAPMVTADGLAALLARREETTAAVAMEVASAAEAMAVVTVAAVMAAELVDVAVAQAEAALMVARVVAIVVVARVVVARVV